MATIYNIFVKGDNGETLRESVHSGVIQTVKDLAADPLFDLGERKTTNRITEGDNTFTTHTYERGTIKVTTRRNQYTASQRQGLRRF